MTQEEKARAYDEAIKKAKSKIKNDKDHILYENDILDIFFELKESEDEKVIRDIKVVLERSATKFFKEEGKMPVWYDRAMAWLEKQGENTYNKELSELLHKVICRFINDPDIPYSDREKVSMEVFPYVERLEKQCEQKPADKVESKFKVGDWVVSPNGVCWHIDKIEDGRYYVSCETGECADWPISSEDLYHQWTILDAKDGDVLFSRNSFIYGKQCPYGGLNWYTGKFIKASNFIFKDGPVHPATKEQRNILFKKMKEAGYEWNAEKKKLKKI